MATIKTTYQGQLRTLAQHLASGDQLTTDAPVDNNGKGEAFSPTDLTCASLGSCMMTIMGIVAQRDEIDLTGTQIEITKTMASNPRRISKIDVQFTMACSTPLSESQKAKFQHAALTCPVALSLHPDIEQQVAFDWNAVVLQDK